MQVTVSKIWPLDPTKKSGGFKGTDSVNYYCEIGAYHLLSEGTTYEVNARPYVSKSTGKTSYIVDKSFHPPNAVVGGAAPSQEPPPQAQNNGWQRPAPQQPAPPRPASNGDSKSGEMFVMGVVGRAMGSGKFETQDIKLLALAAAEAWGEVRGKL